MCETGVWDLSIISVILEYSRQNAYKTEIYLCLYLRLDSRMSMRFCVMVETGVKSVRPICVRLVSRGILKYLCGTEAHNKRWIFVTCERMTVYLCHV